MDRVFFKGPGPHKPLVVDSGKVLEPTIPQEMEMWMFKVKVKPPGGGHYLFVDFAVSPEMMKDAVAGQRGLMRVMFEKVSDDVHGKLVDWQDQGGE